MSSTTKTEMKIYRVIQAATGVVLWKGEAKDEAAAWDAHLIAAGYIPGVPSLDADGKDLAGRGDDIFIE